MVNVNPTEVGSLLIPLPSKAKQAELLKPLTVQDVCLVCTYVFYMPCIYEFYLKSIAFE